MKKILKIIFISVMFLQTALIGLTPNLVFAANENEFTIRPDCNQGLINGQFVNSQGEPDPCDFEDLLELIRNIIRFVVLYLSLPVMAAAFAYAGFLIMTSGVTPANRNKAKEILWKVLKGFLWAVSAWLIVETIYSSLGYSGFLQFN